MGPSPPARRAARSPGPGAPAGYRGSAEPPAPLPHAASWDESQQADGNTGQELGGPLASPFLDCKQAGGGGSVTRGFAIPPRLGNIRYHVGFTWEEACC